LGFDFAALRRERMLELLKPEEVSELSRGGLDVQMHTHRHRAPSRMDRFEEELRDNRMRIEELTGRTPRHFCYPSGRHETGMAEVLRAAGVIAATTCAPGLAGPATDPLLVPRFLDMHHIDDLAVESWLSGAAEFLPKRRESGMGEEIPYIDRSEPAAATESHR
jgi:peptidoglycan/xylan/chitin deacetylase (PgdA/CDA1 family)